MSNEKTFKKTLPFIFIVDNSNEMNGESLATINEVMYSIGEILSDVSEKHKDYNIAVLIISALRKVQNVTSGFINIEDFYYTELESDFCFDMCNSLEYLCDSVLVKEYFEGYFGKYGYYKPIITLLSATSQNKGVYTAIENLYKNSLFNNSLRIAIPIEKDNNMSYLEKFTRTTEAIISPYGLDAFEQIISPIDIPLGLEVESEEDYSSVFEIMTRDNNKLVLLDKENICLCQIRPSSPDKALTIAFELSKTNHSVLINNKLDEKISISYCIKRQSARTFLFDELECFCIKQTFIASLRCSINDRKITFINEGLEDVFLSCTANFIKAYLKDGDYVSDKDNIWLIKVSKQDETPRWDDDEW
ncbi:hypothetical protein [Ruminococcus sp. zg-924]|uniref:hypothetical protein n=1 Tax=Ruminococcus sp. zg-924 TaxID=2678505 RepID=UPI00210E1B80|nr:hypothetical protein [Ruminococcus sp. zg-924]MCQ4022828.1 hypothetical protein [Ruminococcus sp. zg-924]